MIRSIIVRADNAREFCTLTATVCSRNGCSLITLLRATRLHDTSSHGRIKSLAFICPLHPGGKATNLGIYIADSINRLYNSWCTLPKTEQVHVWNLQNDKLNSCVGLFSPSLVDSSSPPSGIWVGPQKTIAGRVVNAFTVRKAVLHSSTGCAITIQLFQNKISHSMLLKLKAWGKIFYTPVEAPDTDKAKRSRQPGNWDLFPWRENRGF